MRKTKYAGNIGCVMRYEDIKKDKVSCDIYIWLEYRYVYCLIDIPPRFTFSTINDDRWNHWRCDNVYIRCR